MSAVSSVNASPSNPSPSAVGQAPVRAAQAGTGAQKPLSLPDAARPLDSGALLLQSAQRFQDAPVAVAQTPTPTPTATPAPTPRATTPLSWSVALKSAPADLQAQLRSFFANHFMPVPKSGNSFVRWQVGNAQAGVIVIPLDVPAAQAVNTLANVPAYWKHHPYVVWSSAIPPQAGWTPNRIGGANTLYYYQAIHLPVIGDMNHQLEMGDTGEAPVRGPNGEQYRIFYWHAGPQNTKAGLAAILPQQQAAARAELAKTTDPDLKEKLDTFLAFKPKDVAYSDASMGAFILVLNEDGTRAKGIYYVLQESPNSESLNNSAKVIFWVQDQLDFIAKASSATHLGAMKDCAANPKCEANSGNPFEGWQPGPDAKKTK